jgi:hypothetical protein
MRRRRRRQLFTPKGLDSTAQGRGAHPGGGPEYPRIASRSKISTSKGLNLPCERVVYHPFGVENTYTGTFSQGALRDPGLWNTTPSGYRRGLVAVLPGQTLVIDSEPAGVGDFLRLSHKAAGVNR